MGSDSQPEKVAYASFVNRLESTVLAAEAAQEDEDPEITEILDTIRNHISVRRIHVKPMFQDYDRHNLNRVTRSQFRAVFDKMRLGTRFTEEQHEKLMNRFGVLNGQRDTGLVNYKLFTSLVDGTEVC